MLDSPVEEIKRRLDIQEVLADYIQMKKAGANLKAVCPFHSEKTPSLMVSPSKQIWHCFGCGLGGDVFEFIKQAENIDFGQALKILADRAGVELTKPTAQDIQVKEKKDVLYDINAAAAKYFAKILWESPVGKEALEYLKKRGLTDQTIVNWQLGFATDDFHALEASASRRFDKRDIEMAGLIVKRDEGRGARDEYFDRFRDRIMFPIHNLHGQVVGFTGRLLHDKENTGKYINSPETPIYNKSREIYGLHAAKNHIRKENRCLLVEGNMDVISCHQAGTQIAVASSGTAITADQLLVLKRLTENLIFAFDTDAAGFNATKRALEQALSLGFNVKIVRMTEAKDPDELIRKGIGIWQKALETAPNFIEFFFEKTFERFNSGTVEDKREITKELVPLIVRMSDTVTKAHFIRKLSMGLNVAETAIWDMVKKTTLPKPAAGIRNNGSGIRKSRKEILEGQVLGLSLFHNTFDDLRALVEADFADPEHRTVFISLKSGGWNPQQLNALEKTKQQVELLMFAASNEVEEQKLDPAVELAKYAKELKKLSLKERMTRVSESLTQAEKSKDKAAVERLSKEFTELSSEIAKIA